MDPAIRALFHPAPGLTFLDTATRVDVDAFVRLYRV
jgi:hypothetical protein